MVIFKHTKNAEALRYTMWSHVLLSSHNCQEASKGKWWNINLYLFIFFKDVLFFLIFTIRLYSKNLQWIRNLFSPKRFGRGRLNLVSWNTGWETEAFRLQVSSFRNSASPGWCHFRKGGKKLQLCSEDLITWCKPSQPGRSWRLLWFWGTPPCRLGE